MIEPIQQNEEFVEDYLQADRVTGAIHVWWLGHACFLIKWNSYNLLIDPLRLLVENYEH